MVGMSGHYILDVPAPKVPGAPPRCASRVSVPYIDTYTPPWIFVHPPYPIGLLPPH